MKRTLCAAVPGPSHFYLARFAAALVVLLSVVPGYATCDPSTDPDKTDIANARTAVAANCDCAGATNHGAYVSCAAQQANAVLTNKSCAGFVKKCASHSTCGKPNAVTCCLTTTKGSTCKVKPDAARCTAKQGMVGGCTSCCDSCPTPGPLCTRTTTTSTTFPPPCGPDGKGSCGGTCFGTFDECVQDPQTGNCGCVLGPCRGVGGFGSCGGTCPSPATCGLCASCGGCGCVIACNGGDGPPTCNGTCPTGYTCGYSPDDHFCACHP